MLKLHIDNILQGHLVKVIVYSVIKFLPEGTDITFITKSQALFIFCNTIDR